LLKTNLINDPPMAAALLKTVLRPELAAIDAIVQGLRR
jgi:hypothetical protein